MKSSNKKLTINKAFDKIVKNLIALQLTFFTTILILTFGSCGEKSESQSSTLSHEGVGLTQIPASIDSIKAPNCFWYRINEEITMGNYFKFLDRTILLLKDSLKVDLNEYHLVHTNDWIIGRLRNTDYYFLKDLGIISLDPKEIPIFFKGDILNIPDSSGIKILNQEFEEYAIDVNIPEFKLRITRSDSILFSFLIRVGKNKSDYLKMAGRSIDLRTQAGEGKIVRINKSPTFINPKDNHIYKVTRRDDDVVTGLPVIPWLEPELNGRRLGQLLHPTTNLKTLGKPASNGCMGMRESDAWILYYYAPLGTKVNIRYDLNVQDSLGNEIILPNIYPGFENKSFRKKAQDIAAKVIEQKKVGLCTCI